MLGFKRLTGIALFKYAQEKNFAIPAVVCLAEIPDHEPGLPNTERNLFFDGGRYIGSCTGQEFSNHPPGLPGRCCILCRQGQNILDNIFEESSTDEEQGVKNDKQQASVAGAVAAAHYIRSVAPAYGIPVVLHTDHCAKKLLPWLDGMMDADEEYFKQHGEPLFSSHMIDLSEEAVDWNIETTAKYLKRAAPMKQWLEMVSRNI